MQTHLHCQDERLIDTKGLLRGDEQGGDARDGARVEEALTVHVGDDGLVGAVQHPVGDGPDAVSETQTR